MASNKPAIVLAHGAWHLPTHFSNVIENLQAAGYEVEAPTSASVSGTAGSESLSKDTAIIKASIETLTNQGKDVVLMMHSYGGNYGSEAVAEWHLDLSNKQPGKGRIVHLFYICATILPAGSSIVDDKMTMHIMSLEDGLLHHMEPFYRFYADVPLPVARQCIAKLRPHDASSFSTKSKHRGWADYDVPVTYLACKKDMALFYDPDLLKFVERLRDAGVMDFELVEMEDASHSPWLSREEEFMSVLWKVVGKAEGKGSAKM